MKIRIAYQSYRNTDKEKKEEKFCKNCKSFKPSERLGDFDGVCMYLNRYVNTYTYCDNGFRRKFYDE